MYRKSPVGSCFSTRISGVNRALLAIFAIVILGLADLPGASAAPTIVKIGRREACVFKDSKFRHAQLDPSARRPTYKVTSASAFASWKRALKQLQKVAAPSRQEKSQINSYRLLIENYQHCAAMSLSGSTPTPTPTSTYRPPSVPSGTPTPTPPPTRTATPSPTPTQVPCALTVPATALNATERTPVTATLPRPDCPLALRYELVVAPLHGQGAILPNGEVQYRSAWDVRTDQMTYRVCADERGSCGAPAPINFTVAAAGAFAGAADSLAPYRESLTAAERAWIVDKLALNQQLMLKDGADRMSLTQFLSERVLNPNWVSPDLRDALLRLKARHAQFRVPDPYWQDEWTRVVETPSPAAGEPTVYYLPGENFTTVTEQQDALERYMRPALSPYHPTLHKYYWANSSISYYLMMRARYLSPSAALMTHILLGHFGINSNNVSGGDEHIIGRYLKTVERESLGNFARLLLGTTPDGCGQPGSSAGILCDTFANTFLANEQNTPESPNQNFSRELMELFTMSPIDPRSGLPNYTDIDDIETATSFVSGYQVQGDTYFGHLAFVPARHDQLPHSMFGHLAALYPELPIRNQSMTPKQFVRHLMDRHPSVPYFLARKIFSMLVYPDPSDALVEQLAADFKATDYNIGALLMEIGRSEAFFSAHARQQHCVQEPFRVFTRVINGLGLPLINHSSDAYATDVQYDLGTRVTTAFANTGEQHLGWATVFSLDYCGRSPGKDGAGEWLKASRLLGRATGMITMINNLGFRTWDDFRYASLVSQMSRGAASSPDDAIDFFSDRMQVPVSAQERVLLRQYLTVDDFGGGAIPVDWDAHNAALMERKLPGLTVLMTSLPSANVR